jgi:hypothetical protein
LGYPDIIKRIRQIVLEYEVTKDLLTASTINVFLAMNEQAFGDAIPINSDTYPNIRTLILLFNYFGEYVDLKIEEESLNTLALKSIRYRFSLLPKQAMNLLRT